MEAVENNGKKEAENPNHHNNNGNAQILVIGTSGGQLTPSRNIKSVGIYIHIHTYNNNIWGNLPFVPHTNFTQSANVPVTAMLIVIVGHGNQFTCPNWHHHNQQNGKHNKFHN
jgi:hypothetical protein